MSVLPGKPAANSGPEQEGATASLSLGGRLRSNRESMGLSTLEAADRLHLSHSMVKALEADDYSALPSAIFIKGYLKSYARLLKLPGAELVRAYEVMSDNPQSEAVKPVEAFRERGIWGPVIVMVAVLLVVLAGIYFFWPEPDSKASGEQEGVALESAPKLNGSELSDERESGQQLPSASEPFVQDKDPVNVSTVEAETIENSAPVQNKPVLESGEEVEPGSIIDTEIDAEIPEDGPQPVTLEQPNSRVDVDAQEEVSAELLSSTVSAGNGLPEMSGGMVSMAFTGDCWVEVRDASGVLLYSDLKRNGETLTVSGQPPLEAKLGDGSAVSLTYNEQPVSFKVPPHKVVRVRLGQ